MSGASQQTAAALKIAESQPEVELHVEHEHLAGALVAALAELTVVHAARTADAGSYSYKYADIGDVVKLTRPVLARHGLVALTPLHDHGTGLACSVVIVHTSGERLDLGPFPFPHGRDAQATGSMVTYHRRYALVAALGMAAGDDDDGAAAKPRPSEAERAAQEKAAHDAAKEAAKDIVRELAEGDVEQAKAAWRAIGGGKWDRGSLTAAYEAWVNQPKDDAPVEGEG